MFVSKLEGVNVNELTSIIIHVCVEHAVTNHIHVVLPYRTL